MSYIGINNTANNTINTTVGRKNYLINGNFDIWQRGTTQTTNGYGSADRWFYTMTTSTAVISQQTHPLGQTDIPSNPKYFSRMVVTSVANAGSIIAQIQRIENGVRLLAGKTCTLSFYAKADASKNMAVEFLQTFGTGGSPSTAINTIGVTTCALTTTWKKFTIPVAWPSIAGKSLGTNNDDYASCRFWFEAGTNFNTRTNSLGQQSGTFDISQVQLEEGLTATSFDYRPIGMELFLCQRYYEESALGTSQKQGTYTNFAGTPPKYTEFKVTKRTTPTLTLYTSITKATPGVIVFLGAVVAVATTITTGYTLTGDTNSCNMQLGGAFSNIGEYGQGHITADAEI